MGHGVQWVGLVYRVCWISDRFFIYSGCRIMDNSNTMGRLVAEAEVALHCRDIPLLKNKRKRPTL